MLHGQRTFDVRTYVSRAPQWRRLDSVRPAFGGRRSATVGASGNRAPSPTGIPDEEGGLSTSASRLRLKLRFSSIVGAGCRLRRLKFVAATVRSAVLKCFDRHSYGY